MPLTVAAINNSPLSIYLILNRVSNLVVNEIVPAFMNSISFFVFSANKEPNITNYTPEYEIYIIDWIPLIYISLLLILHFDSHFLNLLIIVIIVVVYSSLNESSSYNYYCTL